MRQACLFSLTRPSENRWKRRAGNAVTPKVEGAFGDWNPLTITYRENSYTKFTTKHVINSVNGKPWTAEEEKHRQERLKKLAPVPEKK